MGIFPDNAIRREFIRLNRESGDFSNYIGAVIHRNHASEFLPESYEPAFPDQDSLLNLIKQIDGHAFEETLDDTDPDNILLQIEYADFHGEALSCTDFNLVVLDQIENEQTVKSCIQGPELQPVLIADDCAYGWKQALRWGEEHRVIVLFWCLLKDGYLNWSPSTAEGKLSEDAWARGHACGYKQGWSEGYAKKREES